MELIKTHKDLKVYQNAFECAFHYINQDEFNNLNDRYDHILSQLVLMINSPEKWSL
jgi:hypothetical protein